MKLSWAALSIGAGCLAFPQNAASSTCLSIADGPFTSPSSWDCGCNPAACDTLIVSHHLTLTTDYSDLSQQLTITSTGHIESSMRLWLESEVFNYGHLEASRLLLAQPGQLHNEGTITAEHFETNICAFTNIGSIVAEDTLWMYCPMMVENLGELSGPHMLLAITRNLGTITTGQLHCGFLENPGTIQAGYANLSTCALYNSGLFQADSIHSANHIENDAAGSITCGRLSVLALLRNYGTLRVHGTWLNGNDTADADSRLYAGSVNETGNFINAAGSELRGSSTLCIMDHSENHGLVSGPIGICDMTTPALTSPFMDVHDGDLQPPITQCPSGPCAWTSIDDVSSLQDPVAFPVPTEGLVTIKLGPVHARTYTLCLLDPSGRAVWNRSKPFGETVSCDFLHLQTGPYMLVGKDNEGRQHFSVRLIIAR